MVETLKEFRTIVLGHKSIIYTDNKILPVIFNTDRILRWRPIIEEYGTNIEHIKGEKNIVANAPSILSLNGNQEKHRSPLIKRN